MPFRREEIDKWEGSVVSITEIASPNKRAKTITKNLHLTEKLLIMNGYKPIYVDLTREDLDIPVVKALVPGLEIMTVVDRFSPLSIRQFGHYLKNCN